MSAPDAGAVPAPGSDAAIKAGCTCWFVYSNIFNRTSDGRAFPVDVRIDTKCPLHGDPLPDLHLRPRTDAETGGRDVD